MTSALLSDGTLLSDGALLSGDTQLSDGTVLSDRTVLSDGGLLSDGGSAAEAASTTVPTRPSAPRRRRAAPRTSTAAPYLAAVPNCEPPFDDERSASSRIRQLRQAPRTIPRSVTGSDRIEDADVPGWSQEPDIGVRRTTTSELPAAERSGRLLSRALVEVLTGRRPVQQLRVHCAPEVFAGLQSKQILPGPPGQVLTVRICEPADGVAEVSAVFRRGRRAVAMAFRMQGVDGRWRVTALQTA